MKVLDVSPFQNGLDRNSAMLHRVGNEMRAIRKTIEGLVAMDSSLKGEGGRAIRSFYEECHLPFLQFFDAVSLQYIGILNQMSSALDSLEPNSAGFIRQGFLEGEVEQGLQTIGKLTADLTDEANSIMDQVADIVYLPRLNDTDVQEGVRKAGIQRDDTITQLYAFDAHQTGILTSFETNFRTMETWIADIEGLINDGLTDVNFPTDLWKEYTATSPLKTEWEHETDQVDDIEASGEEIETGEVSSAEKTTTVKLEENVKLAGTALPGAHTGFAMYMAQQKSGLFSSGGYRDLATGKNSYRVYANEQGLKYLGVELRNGKNNEVLLKAASKKPGQSQWFSREGQAAIKNHPELEYWSDKATRTEKAKNIGKATLKGTGRTFTDLVDVKGIKDSGFLKGSVKALGPIGVGLNIHNNYESAKEAGLTGGAAATRVAVDTTIDTAVAGGVQAAFTAAGTVLIPIPGVGTAVGVGIGLFVNGLLNKKSKKTGKSKIDEIKEKARSWFD